MRRAGRPRRRLPRPRTGPFYSRDRLRCVPLHGEIVDGTICVQHYGVDDEVPLLLATPLTELGAIAIPTSRLPRWRPAPRHRRPWRSTSTPGSRPCLRAPAARAAKYAQARHRRRRSRAPRRAQPRPAGGGIALTLWLRSQLGLPSAVYAICGAGVAPIPLTLRR